MDKLAIKIPTIKASFYDNVAAKANYNKVINTIRPKYGKIIDYTASITKVPSILIESFIFIESAGDEKASTPYATGLMQVGNAAASDAIVFEKGAGRLDAREEAILKKYLGSRYDILKQVKPKQKSLGKTFITKQDLLNPEFNILIGSMILGQLLDELTENGVPRLDKIVVVYNRGRFDKVSKKAISFKGDTNKLIAAIPSGTGNYIKKLSGTNGLLDSLV